jgi:allantoin racemase
MGPVTMRLWHQSSTELQSAPYRDMLLRRAAALASAGTEVVLHGVAPGTWPLGDARRGIYECPYTNLMLEVQCARNIIEAEDCGYDAFVYSCFEDPGLRPGRSMVDIPVVGMLESSLLVATTMGHAPALIGTSPSQADRVGEVARRDRLDARVACVTGTAPLGPGVIDGGSDGGEGAIAAFQEAARLAIARGADVLIPAEGIINVLLADLGVREVDGVPVVDSWAVVLGYAEMLVRLRVTVGQTVSRAMNHGRVDREVARHVARHTAEVLAR